MLLYMLCTSAVRLLLYHAPLICMRDTERFSSPLRKWVYLFVTTNIDRKTFERRINGRVSAHPYERKSGSRAPVNCHYELTPSPLILRSHHVLVPSYDLLLPLRTQPGDPSIPIAPWLEFGEQRSEVESMFPQTTDSRSRVHKDRLSRSQPSPFASYLFDRTHPTVQTQGHELGSGS